MNRTTAVVLFGLALLVTACGGGESERFTATVSTPTPSPSQVETDACRTAIAGTDNLAEQVDIARTDDVSGLSALQQRAKIIGREVTVHCTGYVQDPMNMGAYHLARAAARAQACQIVTYCSDGPIVKDLVAASRSLRQAATASERTG